MPELTPRDDDRKRVSEILKRVDQLIKAGSLELAQKEVENARAIDPKNVYVHAYQERLIHLLEEREQKRKADEEAVRKFQEEQKRLDEERRRKEEEQRKKDEEERRAAEQRRAEEERLRKEEDARRAQRPVPAEPTVRRSSRQPKRQSSVLVIDDDERLLEMLAATLEDANFDVRAVTTTDEAYTLLREYTPDLILSDINLETSTMGGFTFYEKVREMDNLYHVPFVFLSGLSDDALIRMGKELGVDDYITKPFSDETLISTIKGKIKRARQLKERMNKQS